MKKYNINYWLSKQFKNSECKNMLENVIEADIIYNFIDWKNQSYQIKKQNVYLDYEFGDAYTRNIDAKLYCSNRFINILINRSGNNVIVIDKKIKPAIKYCNNYVKEDVDVYKLSHNADNTSYFSHKKMEITNTGYEKTNQITSIHINDYTGNLISYYDSEEDKAKSYKSKNKTYKYTNKKQEYN
ncbi:MAG: hypothetical protein IJF92_05110 [Bacilli bacterium]|nr:hypothetical protein [Bacilli bacterium]